MCIQVSGTLMVCAPNTIICSGTFFTALASAVGSYAKARGRGALRPRALLNNTVERNVFDYLHSAIQ